MKYLWLLILLSGCSSKSSDPIIAKNYAVIEGAKGKFYHTGLLHAPDELEKRKALKYAKASDCGELPETFDLRLLAVVPEVRDQGQCGSCWSFSKTGSLESALLGAGQKMDLAEQDQVSCDRAQYGCDGGLLSDFKYLTSHGAPLEKDYPYTSGRTGQNGSCKSVAVAAKGVSFMYIGSADRGPTESELKCALYKFKTVPWITVSASSAWGSPPASEKTMYTRCGRGQTNHAVGVVGWFKNKSGKTAFIMKNSWGLGWGDKGYMSLPLGCDSFGDEVAFIQVAAGSK